MARVKITQRQIREKRRRTTWTRFYLPRGQDWPAWLTSHPDTHLGPLLGVAGCEKVYLGRKVDDPEQAVIAIVWESMDALQNFQNSPTYVEFLQGLPESDVQASLASGALLRDLSLNNTSSSSSSFSSPLSRFRVLNLSSGWFQQQLEGRITVNIFLIPYTGVPTPMPWYRAVFDAVGKFLPSSHEHIRYGLGFHTHFWTAWTWMDRDFWAPEEQAATAENESGQAVLCEFRRWNGWRGLNAEAEEASAKDPLTRESWARKVAEAMPPVSAWEQERWDIQTIPAPMEEMEYEEDSEFERNLE